MGIFKKRPFKKRGKRVLGTQRVQALDINPKPRLREITWDVFERACLAIGADPDAMFSGQVESAPATVPVSKAIAFLEVVLDNFDEYDFRAYPPEWLEVVAGKVAGVFFFQAAKVSVLRRAILNGLGLTRLPQPPKGVAPSISVVSLRDLIPKTSSG